MQTGPEIPTSGMPRADERGRGIIVIPARVASTRLPQKLLLKQSGRPLLSYAVEQAKTTVQLFPIMFRDVYVAGDDERLWRIAEEYGAKAIRTHSSHRNGTSRIAEAMQILDHEGKGDFVVNLQGDHPEVSPEAIVQVVMALLENPAADMSTAAVLIDGTDGKSPLDRDVVKVSFDQAGRATNFSRTLLFQGLESDCSQSFVSFRHIGLYAYRTKFLTRYANWPPSPRELREDLEQLRALEHRADIRVVALPFCEVGHGIDTAEEYASFVQRIGSQCTSPNAGDGNP